MRFSVQSARWVFCVVAAFVNAAAPKAAGLLAVAADYIRQANYLRGMADAIRCHLVLGSIPLAAIRQKKRHLLEMPFHLKNACGVTFY